MRFYLIGFMGSGKSYWAHKWAQRYQLACYDIDATIEEQEQDTIAGIFESKGEEWFRNKEAALLRETSGFNKCIIACGGGTPCYHNNMEWMKLHGLTVYLQAPVNFLVERLRSIKGSRPVLKDANDEELADRIERMLGQRKNIYELADIILDATLIDEDTFNAMITR